MPRDAAHFESQRRQRVAIAEERLGGDEADRYPASQLQTDVNGEDRRDSDLRGHERPRATKSEVVRARDFDEEILPVLRVDWVDEPLYRLGADRLWREDRRHMSLVDCISFELMKREGIRTAFAIDPHFTEAGFDLLP